MKRRTTTPRKLLALLLALTLAVGLALPALAEGETNPAPVFTKSLPKYTLAQTGDTLVLEAKAELPDGVNAELQYRWYTTGITFERLPNPDEPAFMELEYFLINGLTEPRFEMPLTAGMLGWTSDGSCFAAFCLEAYYVTDDGEVVAASTYTLFVCTYTFRYIWDHSSVVNLPDALQFIEIISKISLLPLFALVYISGATMRILYQLTILQDKLSELTA